MKRGPHEAQDNFVSRLNFDILIIIEVLRNLSIDHDT